MEVPILGCRFRDVVKYFDTQPAGSGEILWQGRPGGRCERVLPRDVYGNSVRWAKGQNPCRLYDRLLVHWPDVAIYPPDGFLRLQSGELVGSTFWLREQLDEFLQIAARPLHVIEKPGRWFSLVSYWSLHYFHWFADALPRLFRVLELLPSDVRFLIPPRPKRWMLRTLERLGVPSRRCEPLPEGMVCRLEHFYFSPPLGVTGDVDPEAMRWLQESLAQPSRRPFRRLYVSRQLARYRRIDNHESVEQLLEKYGFETLCAEQHPIDRQIELFGEAAMICGPHGAGLTNMLFSKPGLRVIEIHEPVTLRRCYFGMARALGNRHRIVVGKSTNLTGFEPDIVAPLDDLEIALQEACDG